MLGRVTQGGEYEIITSERLVWTPSAAGSRLLFTPRPYPMLVGRWPDKDVARFIASGNAPTFSSVVTLIVDVLDELMEFPRSEHRVLLAAWAVGTYFFPLFLSFPRLSFSGERGSGKSKALAILAAISWNGLLLVNPTPATLFRLIEEFRPTLLLDEMERLNKTSDAKDLLDIIHSGYKRDGSVPRCEGQDKKHVELFATYAPLALAAIRGFSAVTEDRCIPLTLQPGTDRARINTEVDPNAGLFPKIRAWCHRLLLGRWREVRDTYHDIVLPEWLNGRPRELWKPLLVIAELADGETDLGFTQALLTPARDHVEDRESLSAEAAALLAVLCERLGDAPSMVVHPGDLTKPLRNRLGWRDGPRPEVVAGWLRRLGFSKANPRRDRDGVRYEVTADRLKDLQARHSPQGTYTPTSVSANPSSSKDSPARVGSDVGGPSVGSQAGGRSEQAAGQILTCAICRRQVPKPDFAAHVAAHEREG